MTYEELRKAVSDFDIVRFMLISLGEETKANPRCIALLKAGAEAKQKLQDFGVEFEE